MMRPSGAISVGPCGPNEGSLTSFASRPSIARSYPGQHLAMEPGADGEHGIVTTGAVALTVPDPVVGGQLVP